MFQTATLYRRIGDRQKSGKDDENSIWSRARAAQFLQVLSQLAKGEGRAIAGVDLAGLDAMYLRGIVWWDEKHKQCKLGHTSKTESRVCVNAAGEPTRPLDGGEFPPLKPNTALKYPGEARGMFGAVMHKGALQLYQSDCS